MSGDGLTLVVQNASRQTGVPARSAIERWARHAFADTAGELVVRIVDEPESAALNERYRGRQGPTNVLAFPAGDLPAMADEPGPLGDIVICAPVVGREADEQSKPAACHWAHLIIHGCLHLQGFDHLREPDAAAMETRERELLAGLGIPDPYAVEA